jgi:hypothetical protein
MSTTFLAFLEFSSGMEHKGSTGENQQGAAPTDNVYIRFRNHSPGIDRGHPGSNLVLPPPIHIHTI